MLWLTRATYSVIPAAAPPAAELRPSSRPPAALYCTWRRRSALPPAVSHVVVVVVAAAGQETQALMEQVAVTIPAAAGTAGAADEPPCGAGGLPVAVAEALAPAVAGPADAERRTRQLAHSHYENFSVVSLLLPRDLRQDFCNIYAFCRVADDLGDELGDRAAGAAAPRAACASKFARVSRGRGRHRCCSSRCARRSGGTRSRRSRSST